MPSPEVHGETNPFPEDRDVSIDYSVLRYLIHPEVERIRAYSPLEAAAYWDDVKVEYIEELGYSPESFSQLSDMAFQDIRDSKLLERPNLSYIEVERAMGFVPQVSGGPPAVQEASDA